jgi:hypothetical protein
MQDEEAASIKQLPTDILTHLLQQLHAQPELLDLQMLQQMGRLNWYYFQATQALFVVLMEQVRAYLIVEAYTCKKKVLAYRCHLDKQDPVWRGHPEHWLKLAHASPWAQKMARILVVLSEDARLHTSFVEHAKRCRELLGLCSWNRLVSHEDRLQWRRSVEALLLNTLRLAEHVITVRDPDENRYRRWRYDIVPETVICTNLEMRDSLAHIYCWDAARQVAEPLQGASWLCWVDDEVLTSGFRLSCYALECERERQKLAYMTVFTSNAIAELQAEKTLRNWLSEERKILPLSENSTGKPIHMGQLVIVTPDGPEFLWLKLRDFQSETFVLFHHAGTDARASYHWHSFLREASQWCITIQALNDRMLPQKLESIHPWHRYWNKYKEVSSEEEEVTASLAFFDDK